MRRKSGGIGRIEMEIMGDREHLERVKGEGEWTERKREWEGRGVEGYTIYHHSRGDIRHVTGIRQVAEMRYDDTQQQEKISNIEHTHSMSVHTHARTHQSSCSRPTERPRHRQTRSISFHSPSLGATDRSIL